ncbi:MAG TPA: WD40 repeat domain-containing protein [Gemmataceae bacterium]|nr:WD40 repeat domain-containing protein [Gemmataceae bacterium]
MRGILGRGAALGIVAAAAVGWALSAPAPEAGEPDPRTAQEIEAAKDDLRELRKHAENPNADLHDLWMEWQRFRTKHAGTPEWREACVVMAKAPSPLDKLDREQIPDCDRFDWQPPGLVAVLGDHRARCWGPIVGLAVSPDGKTIAATGGGLWLWDTGTQRDKVLLLDRHGWGVPVFSQDGRTLAAQCGSNVCLWDLSAVQPRKRMSFNANPFVKDPKFDEIDATQDIYLVGDGKTLIGGGRYEYRWWDVSGDAPKDVGTLVLRLKQPADELRFASDGRTATGVANGVNQFRVFDWADGRLKERTASADVCDLKTAFSADNRTMATLVHGGELQLWDLTTETPKPTVKSDGIQCSALRDLGFAPDGRLLAALDRDRTMWLWALDADAARAAGMKPGDVFRRTSLPFEARCLCLTPDRRTVVVGCEDGTLHLWDVAGDKERVPLRGQTGPIEQIAFSPDARTLAVLGQDGWAHLWDLGGNRPRERTAWRAHPGAGRNLLFTPEGDRLFTLGSERAPLYGIDSTVCLWDVKEDKPKVRRKAEYPEEYFRSMALSPDGRFLAFGGRGPLPDDKNRHSGLARLVDPLEEGLPTLYDIRPAPTFAKDEVAAELEVADVYGIAFAPDGKTLALALHANTRCLSFSTKTFKERAAIIETSVSGGCITFTPDSKKLVVAGWQDVGANKPEIPVLRLWDVSQTPPQPGSYCTTNGKTMRRIELSPAGSWLLSVNEDFDVELWEVANSTRLCRWEAPDRIRAITFSPDGRYFATANENGTVYVVRIGEMRKEAKPEK